MVLVHTEEHSVVLRLLHAVVLEEHSRVRVHVGPGVLGLAVLGQDSGGDLQEFVWGVNKGCRI